MDEVKTDVLIIGSGIAGLYTALHLAGHKRVLLATAGSLNSCNTFLAQGGVAAALGDDDTPQLHYEDTLAAGAHHCLPEAVSILTAEGPACVADLLQRGVPFVHNGTDGNRVAWALAQEAAHSRRRVAYVGDATGREIHGILQRDVVADDRIVVWTGHSLHQLLTDSSRCRGALLCGMDGKQVKVAADYTVLATGGLGQLYTYTTNAVGADGSGMVLAYEAGAALVDLELVQFHPTALWHEGRSLTLVTEALRGEGAVLRNAAGDRFLAAYDSRAELAPRDVVARAVFAQMGTDATAHVWLDATGLGTGVRGRFPTVSQACAAMGLDLAHDLIPVVPAAHYSMGGVHADLTGATTLPGLFAVGEVACTGVHGANRLASNSLLEGLVFARRAAAWLADAPCTTKTFGHSFGRTDADANNKSRVQQIMWETAGLVRSESGLKYAEQQLALLAPDRSVTLARLLVAAALQRRESRGAHYRNDYPESKPEWAGHRIFHHITERQGLPA